MNITAQNETLLLKLPGNDLRNEVISSINQE